MNADDSNDKANHAAPADEICQLPNDMLVNLPVTAGVPF